MRKYFLTVSVAAFMTAGHVWAADVIETYEPPEVPPVVVPTTANAQPNNSFWQGFYVGGQLGGSWADSDVSTRLSAGNFVIASQPPVSLWGGRLSTVSADLSAAVGGLYAGYNFDLGRDVILGLETDVILGSIDDRTGYNSFDVSAVGPATGYLVSRVGIEQKWAGSTRIRVGYGVNDRVLPYISAGVAYGQIKSSVNAYLSATPGGGNAFPGLEYNFRDSGTFIGWTVGTGADYAVTDNVLLRFEYRYADYGHKNYRHIVPGGGDVAVRYRVDHRTHDLRLGAAYKF